MPRIVEYANKYKSFISVNYHTKTGMAPTSCLRCIVVGICLSRVALAAVAFVAVVMSGLPVVPGISVNQNIDENTP
jgi:hypothetical protein